MINFNNIIVCDSAIPLASQAFSQFGNLILLSSANINNDILKDADILVVRTVTKVDEALLRNSNVRLVCTASSGFDHIDLNYLHKKNIAFATAEGANARAVAEYVFNCLKFFESKYSFSLQDKRLGIIGVGKIGSLVKKIAEQIEMPLFCYDPPKMQRDNNFVSCDLSDIYQCDIITLHIPFVRSGVYKTENFINKFFFNNLKKNIFLINSSRGKVLDSYALISHIQQNKIKAILDVWPEEPYCNDLLFENCDIITPHIAGYTLEAKLLATKLVSMRIAEFLQTTCNFDFNEFIPPIPHNYSYNLNNDNLILSEFPHIRDTTEQAILFEKIRKNYPLRREMYNTFFLNDNDPQAS